MAAGAGQSAPGAGRGPRDGPLPARPRRRALRAAAAPAAAQAGPGHQGRLARAIRRSPLPAHRHRRRRPAISGLAAFLAVAAFVGGFAILVLRMDNGAAHPTPGPTTGPSSERPASGVPGGRPGRWPAARGPRARGPPGAARGRPRGRCGCRTAASNRLNASLVKPGQHVPDPRELGAEVGGGSAAAIPVPAGRPADRAPLALRRLVPRRSPWSRSPRRWRAYSRWRRRRAWTSPWSATSRLEAARPRLHQPSLEIADRVTCWLGSCL